jgi:hypothetical protein
MIPSAGDENDSHHQPQQEKAEISEAKKLRKDRTVPPFLPALRGPLNR